MEQCADYEAAVAHVLVLPTSMCDL
jgi:hypothetical protein